MADHRPECPVAQAEWADDSGRDPREAGCTCRTDERERSADAVVTRFLAEKIERLQRERDAARAEVEHLKNHLATLKRLDDADDAEIDRLKETVALRAEVAALRRDLRVERHINDEFVRWKADLRAKIANRYDDIKRQPGHEMNPEYWDGVLDGLDIAEQIVEKEVQP